METETIFRIILPVLIIAFAVHRGHYVRNFHKPEEATLKKREEGMISSGKSWSDTPRMLKEQTLIREGPYGFTSIATT